MKARYATDEDIPACIQMGLRFAEAAGWEADQESIEQTLRMLVEDGGLMIVGEPVGMVGVLVFDNYMCRSEKIAQELFWWVDPESRSGRAGFALLQAAEDHAKSRGAKHLTMVCLERLEADRVGNLYMRRGYVPLERSFMKVL